MQNHFELFGLAPAFALEAEALEHSYRDIQARVHPDRFAHAGDAERRASLQWTTRVNEAYRTLKDPVQRGKHLLELHGVDVAFETNTADAHRFPDAAARAARGARGGHGRQGRVARSTACARGCGLRKDSSNSEIAGAIDADKDYPGAAGLVRKLMFLDRLDSEIDAAYEDIE